MENNKWKNRFMMVLTACVLSLTACGKNNNGGAATPPPSPPVGTIPPGGACGGPGLPVCPQGGTSLLASALGYSNSKDIVLGLNFYSQGGLNADPAVPYYGSYVAQGSLMVAPQASSQFCPIPPGTYQVTGTATSAWQNGAGIQLQLQAVGPASFTFTLQNGFIGRPGSGTMQGPAGSTYPFYLAGYVSMGGNCYPWYIGL